MLADILVKGIVQGVGFRPFVYRLAVDKKLSGFVQNRGDAGVKIVVEGETSQLDSFIHDLKAKKPPSSVIDDIIIDFKKKNVGYLTFKIENSFTGGDERGSIIPPDISICDKCVKELENKNDRRYRYFFITCTDCGPRYTLIKKLPYDRINTSMTFFKMCNECNNEYESKDDRRFHAQTNACSKCGPQLELKNNKGESLAINDEFNKLGQLLDEGNILAVKGNGGFHLICSAINPKPLLKLRKAKHRRAKPFAIMARNIVTIEKIAELNEFEMGLLESPAKPIVLLKKTKEEFLSNLISPGLDTIGIMLPYSGLHEIIFDVTNESALVMTSANPPNEPIVIDNDDAIRKLGNVADYFLLHNRNIEQRCDDSVIRVINDSKVFLRRSRGYAPARLNLKIPTSHDVLALGAELNATCCIIEGNRAYLSQHIGDIETPETLNFLETAAKHLLDLTHAKVEVVACDLHPGFNTTFLCKRFSEKWNIPMIQVQHHHAHLSKLMAEYGIDEAIGIVCDGYGYGSDGGAWGGEILQSNLQEFKRLGHLQDQPMPGGDLATKYPLRMVAGILNNEIDLVEFLNQRVKYFPYGNKEVEIISKQVLMSNTPMTSSCGRVLDAVSAILGICSERTYEGEPAMKLEAIASQGKDSLKLEPQIKNHIIDTTFLLKKIHETQKRDDNRISDLALSAQSYIARSLAELAIECAISEGVEVIGFTGGVACNSYITNMIRLKVEKSGLNFLSHDKVPPGDGGVSLGQAIVAANII
ncbi:carbamoyltransferase HypF [[Eubacterium] cellulosolvens]